MKTVCRALEQILKGKYKGLFRITYERSEAMHDEVNGIRSRHIKRQNQRRRQMKRRRIIFFTVLGLIALSIILFFTPLFNIKSIGIMGNQRIETAVIKQAVGSVEEENLFRLGTKKIEKSLAEIPYVESFEIRKVIIPPSLKVDIVECQPVSYITYNEQLVIVDKTLKVLEVRVDRLEGIGEMTGVNIISATEGAILDTDRNEDLEKIRECLGIMQKEGIIPSLTSINFADMNSVSFSFENRLNIICGSTIDFSKKISMLKMALESDNLTPNSRGTIDLSITGKAIYTP